MKQSFALSDRYETQGNSPQRPRLPEHLREAYRAYGARGWIGSQGKRYDCRQDWESSECRYHGNFTLSTKP